MNVSIGLNGDPILPNLYEQPCLRRGARLDGLHQSNPPRLVEVTDLGRRKFQEELGISLEA